MGTPRIPIPSHLRGRSFLTAEASDFGLARGRTRGSGVDHPFRGVSSIRVPLDTALGRCRAYAPRLRSGQFFCHVSAAAILGIPLPPQADDGLVHIAVARPASPPRALGVRGHALLPELAQWTLRHGVPLAAPEQLWIQLAAVLGHEDLVAAGDALLGDHRGRGRLTTVERLRAAVQAGPRRIGAARIRWALPRMRVGVGSRRETLLRLLIVDAGPPEPEVNPAVVVAPGIVLHPDLGYLRWRIALEYEGDDHRTDRRQWQQDIRRRRLFQEAGWRVLPVTADDLLAPAELIGQLRSAVREAEARGAAS